MEPRWFGGGGAIYGAETNANLVTYHRWGIALEFVTETDNTKTYTLTRRRCKYRVCVCVSVLSVSVTSSGSIPHWWRALIGGSDPPSSSLKYFLASTFYTFLLYVTDAHDWYAKIGQYIFSTWPPLCPHMEERIPATPPFSSLPCENNFWIPPSVLYQLAQHEALKKLVTQLLLW